MQYVCCHDFHERILSACMQTFGWFVQYGTQPFSEHFLVFWVGPLLGGVLAGLTWKLFVEAKPGRPHGNRVPVETSAHANTNKASDVKKGK